MRGLVPIFRLGFPLRYKAGKLVYFTIQIPTVNQIPNVYLLWAMRPFLGRKWWWLLWRYCSFHYEIATSTYHFISRSQKQNKNCVLNYKYRSRKVKCQIKDKCQSVSGWVFAQRHFTNCILIFRSNLTKRLIHHFQIS